MMAALQSKVPSAGEDGFLLEPHTLSVVLKCLPKEVRYTGSRKQAVIHSCFDVSDQYLAMGSEQGYVWILDLHATKLIRELNDFRGTAISVVALNSKYEQIAFGTQDGQTKIESFTKQMSRGYRIQEKDRQRVVAMVWDHSGTRLLCAYSSGKLIKASFQFASEVMKVSPVLECGSCVVQLSSCGPSLLLISTLARSLLLDVDSGKVTQVGTKERKSGPFGGCFSQSSPPDEEGPPVVAYLARPGLRMWTANDSGKVILTTKFRDTLSSNQFPRVPTHNWSSGNPNFVDTWQFSLVLPWLQNFVVTYHESTIWVLDAMTSTVVGVLCLEQKITCVATSGKFVYVLCDGISRPLARFTVHSSFLKSIQKVKARSDNEAVSASSTSGTGDESGEGTRREALVCKTGEGEVEMEEDKEKESEVSNRGGMMSEKLDPTPGVSDRREATQSGGHLVSPPSPTTVDASTHDFPAHQPHSQTSHQPEVQTPAPNEFPEDPIKTFGSSTNTKTDGDTSGAGGTSGSARGQGSRNPVESGTFQVTEEVKILQEDGGVVSVGYQSKSITAAEGVTSISRNSLQDAIETAVTPLLTSDPEEHHSEDSTHVKDLRPDAEPVSDVHPSTTNTAAITSAAPSQSSNCHLHHPTTADPPSVTGPLAMQDLAREVTDLLRPALGKLSGLIRPQDRRKGGGKSSRTDQHSGTATPPQESPLREEEEEENPRGEGTGTPVEISRGPTPKLRLKLGGRLKDKEHDSPSPATNSVGVTPSSVGQEEEERRLRMAQAVGEEDAVSERLTQRKRRKRKTKKHSSKPNSTSASLEKLTDIGNVMEDATPLTSPQVEPVSDPSKETTPLSGIGDQPKQDELSSRLSALLETEESQSKSEYTSNAPPPHTDLPTVTVRLSEDDSYPFQPSGATESAGRLPLTGISELIDAVADNRHGHSAAASAVLLSDKVESPPTVLASTAEVRIKRRQGVTEDGGNTVPDALEPVQKEDDETGLYGSPSQEYMRESLSPRPEDRKMVDSVEVTLGSNLPSQLQSNNETYFKTSCDSLGEGTIIRTKIPLFGVGRGGEMSRSAEVSRQFVAGDEAPLELSDNPLYRDDTSDFTTDTESSQQRSRRGSSAKLHSSSRSSSVAPPSSTASFTAKHMKSKGAASLGVSHAVSDLSWESSLHAPRPRSDRRFTPSASPFEVSNSPADLSSSFQSSCSTTLQPQNQATSLPIPTPSPPTTSNLLHFQEGRRSGEESGSDFSCDETEGGSIEAEHFSLCAAAVDEAHSNSMESPVSAMKSPSPNTMGVETYFDDREQQQESQEDSSSDLEADIWVTVPHPCRGHVQSICLSDCLLWLVDSRNMVYCTEVNTKGKKWELIKHPMQQVSSSPSGCIVWGVYRHNAYVRMGFELNILGQMWKNVTKTTSLAQKIKYVCADEAGVWAVKNDGQIIFRKGVTRSAPQGRVWVEVGRAAGFTTVASCSGVVWATNTSGRLFYRDGVTEQTPSGRKWVEMKAPPLEAVCMTQGNVAWIIDGEGKMGFRCGVSIAQPTGKNPWWEVTVSTTLSHSSLPFNSLWQVMTSEGSQFLSSVSSLIHTHLPGHHKLLAVSASNRAGVCVLESGSKLHACWRSTTGYHYSSASKDGVFQLTTWTMFGSGSTGLWVVRDDGELYCVTPQDKFVRIECASTVQMMAVSSTALWVIANNQLWSRQGMTPALPEGISWDYIELSPQLHSHKLKHIVCGKRAVWAVDGLGVPHFRFGVHSREPGTGMSPAWVPVDDLSHPLHQITVSQNDWLVWACDDSCNSYARTGVTPDFPVGTAWDIVPGQPVKQLVAHGKKVYALTPSGNLLCRYGITETNVQGNYWRQLPGNFVQITVGHGGRLLGLDSKGSILKQQHKTLTVTQESEFLRHRFNEVLDPSWEVV